MGSLTTWTPVKNVGLNLTVSTSYDESNCNAYMVPLEETAPMTSDFRGLSERLDEMVLADPIELDDVSASTHDYPDKISFTGAPLLDPLTTSSHEVIEAAKRRRNTNENHVYQKFDKTKNKYFFDDCNQNVVPKELEFFERFRGEEPAPAPGYLPVPIYQVDSLEQMPRVLEVLSTTSMSVVRGLGDVIGLNPDDFLIETLAKVKHDYDLICLRQIPQKATTNYWCIPKKGKKGAMPRGWACYDAHHTKKLGDFSGYYEKIQELVREGLQQPPTVVTVQDMIPFPLPYSAPPALYMYSVFDFPAPELPTPPETTRKRTSDGVDIDSKRMKTEAEGTDSDCWLDVEIYPSEDSFTENMQMVEVPEEVNQPEDPIDLVNHLVANQESSTSSEVPARRRSKRLETIPTKISASFTRKPRAPRVQPVRAQPRNRYGKINVHRDSRLWFAKSSIMCVSRRNGVAEAARRVFKYIEDEVKNVTRFPDAFRPDGCGTLLNYAGEMIAGLNKPQMYLKLPGGRTIGHLENNCLASLNYNTGPGDCIWYGIPMEYAAQVQKIVAKRMKSQKMLIEGFWGCEAEIIAAGIPLQKFIQKPGDLVYVGIGTYHWVQSSGFTTNLSWNLATPTYIQLAVAAACHDYYLANKYPSLMPIEVIAWNMVMQRAEMDEKMKRLVKSILMRSLANCQFEIDYFSKKPKIFTPKDAKNGDVNMASVERCNHCRQVLFNNVPVVLIKEQIPPKKGKPAKYIENDGNGTTVVPLVFCFGCCAKMRFRHVTVYQRYSLDTLASLFNGFHVSRDAPSAPDAPSTSNVFDDPYDSEDDDDYDPNAPSTSTAHLQRRKRYH
ncbi:hypothetical protein CRE_09573 [Caenorhabditis remanei]|uniref:JmjC domain-containing protein n=1 Tax=Caenorhabditis remanei TaxID=31234 RepID=E3MIY0_CAERE|nr:hypothetical protein CRE_09573 [Caenorhabditis remanei]